MNAKTGRRLQNLLVVGAIVAVALSIAWWPRFKSIVRHYQFEQMTRQADLLQEAVRQRPQLEGIEISVDYTYPDGVIASYQRTLASAQQAELQRLFHDYLPGKQMYLADWSPIRPLTSADEESIAPSLPRNKPPSN